MLLRDLVDHPELGLMLLHGDHALDRRVESVFTTDLLDPSRYLTTDGLLVLTGLVWRRDPADSDAFVQVMARAGVVAMAAGEAAFGVVPDDVVDACRRHDVPLLRVPVEVSFGQISAVIAAAHETARGRLLAAALGRQHRLLTAIAEGRSLDELLLLVSDDVGVECQVLTPTGRRVAGGAGSLAVEDVDLVTRAFLLADRLPVTVALTDGSAVSVVAVDSRLDQRLTAWFLVCAGDHRHWSDDIQVTVRELGTVIAVEHRRWDENRRARQRIADHVVDLVATGHSDGAEMAVRLGDLGVDRRGPCLVVVASRPGEPRQLDAVHAVLHDAALQIDDQPVTGVRDGRAVTILAGDPTTDADRLRTALHRLAPGVGTGRLVAGVSAWVEPEAIAGALDEARHAVRLAELRTAAVSVVTSEEVTSHVLLLGTVPDEVRRTFARRVLGPVLAFDEAHGGDLVPTLDAYLRADGSWTRCARALHVHVNTVRYRIGRVEELTGRDLSRLEDRVDTFLALRSLRAVVPAPDA